ncbi:MAG: transglycosylase SLT domain-containing protein [Actinobacteria bacterium]|nr:transglycosylase SLT domain-containing protein [Actinomycetota bacterium]
MRRNLGRTRTAVAGVLVASAGLAALSAPTALADDRLAGIPFWADSATTVQVAAADAKTERRTKRRIPAPTVRTGPSPYRGNVRLSHPRGIPYYPEVKRWANLVIAVLREHDLPRRNVNGVLAQIQQESSGNPRSVNRWDSNWHAGIPSKGLLQVIAPTYQAYAKKGYRSLKYQTVPYTNIWAAINYVKDVYGPGKFKSWNRGYNQGY